MSTDAMGQGERACAAARPITANPFEQDTPSWHRWRRGWERARRAAVGARSRPAAESRSPAPDRH